LPRFTLWIALGVVGIIGVVVLILILGRNETDNQVGIAPPIDVALVDVTGTAQPLSQSDPFASEPTATLPPVASPSNTLQPTEIAQVVLTDTPEPANTNTPAPTLSPTNTPTLVPLGIEDQFADGLSLDWEVLSGEPLILDQAYLTPGGNDLFIAIGDPRWTDYEIEIGIEAAISGTEHGNFIALRMTDDHLLALAFSGAGGRFWEYDATKWREVPGTVYGNGSLKGQTVRVVVEGNNVTAFVKGLQVKSITTMFPEGRVGLKIIKGSKITFFRVREIQP
jgi:hypothetical protein